MNKEKWRFIEGFEDYQISSFGRIKSLKFGKERIMKPGTSAIGDDYLRIVLSNKGKTYSKIVHQLVAAAFFNHKLKGHNLEVDIISGDKKDVSVKNLRIVSHRNNISSSCFRKEKEKLTSEYVGVCLDKRTNKWRAQIKTDKQRYLGIYETEKEAYAAYMGALRIYNNLKN